MRTCLEAFIGLIISVWFLVERSESAIAKDPDYPTKPINFHIGWTVGGTTDMAVRPLLDAAGQHLGQPFVPINRPGASGALAATSVMNAGPDGYNLGASASSNLVVAPLSGAVLYKDPSPFTQVMNFGVYLYTVMVRADAPWKTWQEFTAWAKKNPGAAKIGITGAKTTDVKGIALTQVEKKENIKFTYVAFKGSAEVLTNILGGHITMYGASIDPSTMSYIKEGKLRPLLYLCKEKMPGYENVPSVRGIVWDTCPQFYGNLWAQRDAGVCAQEAGRRFCQGGKGSKFHQSDGTDGHARSLFEQGSDEGTCGKGFH